MPQAKTLSDKELKIVLGVLTQHMHPERNRALLLMSFYAGMRVGEIAALRFGDVVGVDGRIKDRIYLSASQTKGNKGRTIVLGEKLRKELAEYVDTLKFHTPEKPFFRSQRTKTGFTSNTLSQHFSKIYQWAGIVGASSHSGRRTFITNLANKGVGVRVLMALAGHKHMSTTQLYIDLNDEMLTTAANLV